MSCCGGGGWHNRFRRRYECPCDSRRPPKVMCCGMPGSVCIRLPQCPCSLPMCCPPAAPQCPRPCICAPPPTCCGGCPSPCGSCCGGCAPCCPRPAPCRPRVLFSCEKMCCPKRRKLDDEECPRVSWPDPPKIEMCCSKSCPPQKIDICYMKVCPSPARCCPPNFPCGRTVSGAGNCCPGRNSY